MGGKLTGRRESLLRVVSALCALLLALLPAGGRADLPWKLKTPAQQILKDYITNVNICLLEQGEREINSLFEMYEKFAELGITAEAGATMPEGIEITVNLLYDTIDNLEVRVNNPSRFPAIAASFLRALDPESITYEEALENPKRKAAQATEKPQDSFGDEIELLNGTSPRAYYTYYPNRYNDGVSWLTMTLVFPLAGTWEGGHLYAVPTLTNAPDTYSDHDAEYEGYDSEDGYQHYEWFVTPTPEPDSAAAEYDNYH